MKKLLFLLPLLCLVFVAQARKLDLGLHLETGHTYPLQQVSSGTIVQEVMGQKMSIDIIISGNMDFVVTSKTADVYTMGVKYTKLVMEMKMPQANVTFSSENGANDPMSGIFAKMIGQVFQVEITEKGKVVSVSKLDDLFKNAFADLGSLTEEQKQQILDQVKKAYGEEAFKGSIESMLAVFPQEPVAEGDSWQNEIKLESGMSAVQVSTYTLKGEEDGAIVLAGNGKIATAGKDAYVQSNGMDMKFDLTGTVVSEFKLDKTSGWVISATVDQTMDGKASIKPSEQLPDGLDVPMSMKTLTTYKGEN